MQILFMVLLRLPTFKRKQTRNKNCTANQKKSTLIWILRFNNVVRQNKLKCENCVGCQIQLKITWFVFPMSSQAMPKKCQYKFYFRQIKHFYADFIDFKFFFSIILHHFLVYLSLTQSVTSLCCIHSLCFCLRNTCNLFVFFRIAFNLLLSKVQLFMWVYKATIWPICDIRNAFFSVIKPLYKYHQFCL